MGILPSGTAWGEWGAEELKEQLGFVPKGLEKLSLSYQGSPLPDYAICGLDGSFLQQAAGYILCAVIGILLVGSLCYLFGKAVVNSGKNE